MFLSSLTVSFTLYIIIFYHDIKRVVDPSLALLENAVVSRTSVLKGHLSQNLGRNRDFDLLMGNII